MAARDRRYVPEAGDIVWANFDPQEGRGQAGRRPALVLSPRDYNGRAGLMVCCPLTTRIKNLPFEVSVPGDPAAVVLSDHVKSMDWRLRKAVFKDKAPAAVLADVRAKLQALLG